MESVDTDWDFPFRGLSQYFCTHQKQGNQGMLSRTHGFLRLAYVVIVLLNRNAGIYAYVFALIVSSLAFLNVKLAFCGNAVAILANVLRICINYTSEGDYMTHSILEIFSLLLMALASITVTRLLIRFNEENMASITDAAKAQEITNQTMVQVADKISSHFADAMKMVDELKQCVDTCNFAMENIADSTENTAESIQAQAAMCVEIHTASDTADGEIRAMMDASDRTMQTISEGSAEIQKLKEQAENVASASDTTVQMISRLTAQIDNVQEFIGTILNIAGKTNLLALNASIEAARAGEAGKGFAVVADQIGKLASDSATAAIDTKKLIEHSLEEIDHGNAIVEKATAAIDSVIKGINSLADSTNEISELSDSQADAMKQLESGIEQISEVIQNNSAAAEETSATSEELSAQSEALEQLVGQFKLK